MTWVAWAVVLLFAFRLRAWGNRRLNPPKGSPGVAKPGAVAKPVSRNMLLRQEQDRPFAECFDNQQEDDL